MAFSAATKRSRSIGAILYNRLLPNTCSRTFTSEASSSSSSSSSNQMNLIKQLRERTSAPIKDVKAALMDSNWDIDAAQTELRKRGKVLASKKSARTATEGLLALAHTHNRAALIELNCETDFVARNDIFQHLALCLAKQTLLVENGTQQSGGAGGFHVGAENLKKTTPSPSALL
uniref:Elongation factor Ts, mitochondrial n=1 Tax=Fagus sylvatica TaxID=28930 RepID=A0A2N9IF05_FAGSY